MRVLIFVFTVAFTGRELSGATAAALLNEIETLAAQGRYAEAEIQYRDLIAVQETVPALNALVNFYHAQGRDRDAEPLCRRALEIAERTLDPLDSTLAITLNSLAEIYRSTGRYVSAEPLYRRALAILEARLGPDHPWVARVLNNVASLRVGTGHYEEASALFQRALTISEKGGDRGQVTAILNNLAVCAMDRGKYHDAERYLIRAVQLDTTMLSAVENYATVLREVGRAGQARKLNDRIAKMKQQR